MALLSDPLHLSDFLRFLCSAVIIAPYPILSDVSQIEHPIPPSVIFRPLCLQILPLFCKVLLIGLSDRTSIRSAPIHPLRERSDLHTIRCSHVSVVSHPACYDLIELALLLTFRRVCLGNVQLLSFSL